MRVYCLNIKWETINATISMVMPLTRPHGGRWIQQDIFPEDGGSSRHADVAICICKDGKLQPSTLDVLIGSHLR